MTDNEYDREFKVADKGIFQASCAVNMCRKLLKEQFEFTDDEIDGQVNDSLGHMIYYTVYGVINNLGLDTGVENVNIIRDCIMNGESLRNMEDRLIKK